MGLLRTIYHKFLMVLPTRMVLELEHIRVYGKTLNLKEPMYYGEKIQWLKLYGNLQRYSQYVDKYEVRPYVAEKIGDKYLNELIGVYDDIEQINFDRLPDRFVLKVTHGSGYNIICKDKKNLNVQSVKNKLTKWLKEDYSNIKKEAQYSTVKPRIICEKYIEDGNDDLTDYKIFCFEGEPEFILVNSAISLDKTQDYFDKNWNRLNLSRKGYKWSKNNDSKPNCLIEMLDVAKKLSAEFPFVRVDLYVVEDKIIFGELTFTPAGGSSLFEPIEEDIKIASKINLDLYKN